MRSLNPGVRGQGRGNCLRLLEKTGVDPRLEPVLDLNASEKQRWPQTVGINEPGRYH
ncbi:MAG: hypothetical protein J7L26_05345 [Candidatus Aminicenantes bacterium]|nr:hypothetical protein [Candidatus Aminicenantes bacterium]